MEHPASPRPRIAVFRDSADTDGCVRADRIAKELSLPVVDVMASKGAVHELYLVVSSDWIGIHDGNSTRSRPIVIDFSVNASELRRGEEPTRRQPLARAIGLGSEPIRVIDTTAGLGGDSFLMARWGCSVTAVERSPVIGALLADGLRRALLCSLGSVRDAAERISLVIGDARTVLAKGEPDGQWDVAYLDPMFPPKNKSAANKKELKMCRMLVGHDEDAGDLLETARRSVRKRVVVKRHRHAPPLSMEPNHSYVGSRVRYDVYHLTERGR